jgi:hypothetical protein
MSLSNDQPTVDLLPARIAPQQRAQLLLTEEPEPAPAFPLDLQSMLDDIRRPLRDRLTIERVIARGGMGSIELVEDEGLRRRQAVKVIHPQLQGSAKAVWLFIREARITSQLNHPNIVPVYDIGVDAAGRPYFTMKRVEGRTFGELLSDLPHRRLPIDTLFELLSVLLPVCDGLAFAHSRGVLHCDLKPANIMVGDFGQVYLMDWGVARVLRPGGSRPNGNGDASQHAVVMGTPAFMSPEQAAGQRKELDPRSDVFSMGAILYQLCTQRPPHSSENYEEVLELARAGAPPAPSEVAPDGVVPPELERIVLRAMAREPELRYPTISALKEDLRRFMRGHMEFPSVIYEAGTHIVREGMPGGAAYIVASGRCEVYRTIDGERRTQRLVGPGEMFGEAALLASAPRSASVIAQERTTLHVMTPGILEDELTAMKPWMASLIRTLADRGARR